MKTILLFMGLLFGATLVNAQTNFKAIIKDIHTKQPLAGAEVTISNTTLATKSDAMGMATITAIPVGKQQLTISLKGYETQKLSYTFPLADTTLIEILLSEEVEEGHHEDLDEVVITSTRSSRTIQNIPTRVEVIAGEELDEKANMKAGDIRMLLSESTGIQTQQTSATSANASIRIQGLDGKYSQILRDGFPLYAGFSGGLGLLQIAPLDLKQVEVIKGSSSTLYGGGAIAGLVNLITKKPTEEREWNFMLNGTSALGLDVSTFYGEKFDQLGLTVYAAYNKGTAYDPADIGLTAIPNYDRLTLNPKLYLYLSESSTLSAGINATVENRIGGDMDYVKGKGNSTNKYFEKNKTGRFSTQLEYELQIAANKKLTLRNAISYFDRSIGLPQYTFSGLQVGSFTEANYRVQGESADWVLGLNIVTDKFKEDANANTAVRDYNFNTLGAFVQNTWNISEKFSLESGLRGDYHNQYGFFFLPRVAGLWKISSQLSTRLSGGLGYKAPTVFTEDAERIQFRNVLPLDVRNTQAEKSYGTNFDINFRTPLFGDRVALSINHMFFYTRIDNPILLSSSATGQYSYLQPTSHIDTRGMETNIKVTYQDFKLFIGYTLADVNSHFGHTALAHPLVSKHRLNNVLMYEVEESWKIGLEAYYFSKQKLSDDKFGKAYWTAGFMVEKLWEGFSIFLNFENFGDTRQTKFDTIYTGSIANPTFRDIYAPVDGFVINGGLKIRL